jgi:hypothetical protein
VRCQGVLLGFQSLALAGQLGGKILFHAGQGGLE